MRLFFYPNKHSLRFSISLFLTRTIRHFSFYVAPNFDGFDFKIAHLLYFVFVKFTVHISLRVCRLGDHLHRLQRTASTHNNATIALTTTKIRKHFHFSIAGHQITQKELEKRTRRHIVRDRNEKKERKSKWHIKQFHLYFDANLKRIRVIKTLWHAFSSQWHVIVVVIIVAAATVRVPTRRRLFDNNNAVNTMEEKRIIIKTIISRWNDFGFLFGSLNSIAAKIGWAIGFNFSIESNRIECKYVHNRMCATVGRLTNYKYIMHSIETVVLPFFFSFDGNKQDKDEHVVIVPLLLITANINLINFGLSHRCICMEAPNWINKMTLFTILAPCCSSFSQTSDGPSQYSDIFITFFPSILMLFKELNRKKGCVCLKKIPRTILSKTKKKYSEPNASKNVLKCIFEKGERIIIIDAEKRYMV